MKRTFTATLFFMALCSCLCCVGKVSAVEPQGVELTKVKLNLPAQMEVTPGQTVSCSFTTGLGPMKTDVIVLRQEEAEDIILSIQSLDAYSFKYVIPQKFEYGVYSFCLRRDGVLKGFGKVEYVVPGTSNGDGPEDKVKPDEGMTLWGVVSCDGKAIPGVVVSDGYLVVQTDSRGMYQMKSEKKNNYVFISVPSGYEVANKGVLPLFHKQLLKSPSSRERVDFTLYESGDQTNHTMLYFGDMHMARRTNDRNQFRTFTSEVNEYMKAHSGEKVYAITLGDMTWDQYWYNNLYSFDEYLEDVNAIQGLQIFHTIGNHDHDMNATGDFDTVAKYKQKICPNYYSFNIGKIHYVILDNIQCTNAVAATTTADGDYRTYKETLVPEVCNWLKQDLSFVDKGTPVVVCMHAPMYNKNGGSNTSNASELKSILSGYEATVVTGHTHVVYNVEQSGVTEHNSGAVCAAWWWSGKYYPTMNIGTDGAPAGYRITTVRGKEQKSLFKATGRDESYQFRAYDRNTICFTAENCGIPAERALKYYLEDYSGYHFSSSANEILVNVWDWDPSWKVEILEEGASLSVTRLTNYCDPAFMFTYTIPRFRENDGVTWHLNRNNHIFSAKASSANSTVQIRVTDDEGRVYTQTMSRPFEFNEENYR